MISYSTNWMGPINQKWIEEYGDCWAAGRIDIYGVPGEDYPLEYGLSPMHKEDWGMLSHWLDHHITLELWTLEELLETFEKKFLKRKIRWAPEKRVQCSRCGGINRHSAECED